MLSGSTCAERLYLRMQTSGVSDGYGLTQSPGCRKTYLRISSSTAGLIFAVCPWL